MSSDWENKCAERRVSGGPLAEKIADALGSRFVPGHVRSVLREAQDYIRTSEVEDLVQFDPRGIEAMKSRATFSDWLEQGPKLAQAAGVYVGIKVYASEDDARKAGDIK